MSSAQVKDSRVAAKRINKAGTTDMPTEEQERKEKFVIASARKTVSTLLHDQLANSDICLQNWLVPKGKELFPMDHRLQCSKLYYPYAEGGALHIDLPISDFDIALAKRKEQTLLEKSNIRYTYIGPNEGIQEVGPRLAEFDKALKKRLASEILK